jgi:hypothetical protein
MLAQEKSVTDLEHFEKEREKKKTPHWLLILFFSADQKLSFLEKIFRV